MYSYLVVNISQAEQIEFISSETGEERIGKPPPLYSENVCVASIIISLSLYLQERYPKNLQSWYSPIDFLLCSSWKARQFHNLRDQARNYYFDTQTYQEGANTVLHREVLLIYHRIPDLFRKSWASLDPNLAAVKVSSLALSLFPKLL